MKTTPLGSLIALSALAVAPSVALAVEPTSPSSTATTSEPAPALTTPVQDQPQALDPSYDEARDSVGPSADEGPSEARRREERRKARESQADRDPAPEEGTQATDVDLTPSSPLEITAVPNFFIEDFDIPPFLLPLYQAAGSEYGVPWEVLASINRIETNFGRNLSVSSAGALGWMQFMPATWDSYGVDANNDGEKDPYNPADAIFAAARYLKAAGAGTDLRKSIFAYNHADWYVNDVVDGARAIAGVPDALISSLTGLTQGVFPVAGPDSKINYDGKVKTNAKSKEVEDGDNAADTVESAEGRKSIVISADPGSKVVAVQDGVVERVGQSERLGLFVRIRDQYGNRYTYANLGEVQQQIPVPKPTKEDDAGHEGHSHAEAEGHGSDDAAKVPEASDDATAAKPDADAAAATTPAADAAATTDAATATTPKASAPQAAPSGRVRLPARPAESAEEDPEVSKSAAETPRRIRFRARAADAPAESDPQPAATSNTRVFAHPDQATAPADLVTADDPVDTYEQPTGDLAEYFSIDYGLKASQVTLKQLKAGQAIIAGTVLGKTKLDASNPSTSTVTFEVRPAGKKAPRIDPRPILDGWRLSDKTDFYGAQAKEAVKDGDLGSDASVGQVLLMGKAELQRRVLADKRISVYECGRRDIAAGQIDRRILALLQVLAIRGAEPTVTSLKCGHGYYTSSGNVSHHSTGTAVDIATVYGKTITPATQGEGSITDRAVQEILKLQGNMRPDQIITLMKYQGQDNTLAMGDHDDHIHVGYQPITGKGGKQLEQLLKPGQWDDLVAQLSSIEAPSVSSSPSQYSIATKKRK